MKNNKKIAILSLLVLTIISLSIGYSTYKSDLKITGIASNVRPVTDIRVTGMNLEIDSTGTSTYNEYNYDRIITGFSLSNQQDYMRYKVTVTNIGSTEMAITNISGVPDSLDYSIENYSLNQKLCNDNNECKLGISKEFYIKLKPKQFSSVAGPFQEVYNLNLIFSFKQFHSVSYIGLENNNLPNEVVDGESLIIDLGVESPSYLLIKIDGVEINDYIYENGVLTIPNVNGDVSIEKVEIPSEYQQVEYIESSGTQYIDTEYAFVDDFSWEIDFEGLKPNTTLFGGRVTSNRTAILYQSSTNNGSVTTSPIGTNNGSQTPFQLNDLSTSRHVVKMSVAANKGSIWVDNVQMYNDQAFNGDYITGTSQVIFADNFGADGIKEFAMSKVYNLKMWQGKNIVRNLIPCYRKSDNVIGMYDLVEGKFYTNQGTGNFEKGNDV